MDHTLMISEFTVSHKNTTPNTAARSAEQTSSPPPCPFCQDNLAAVTLLRKREILLEYELEQTKEQLAKLNKQNEELINTRVLTYNEYKQRFEIEQPNYWRRQDIEAELFEAKILIELLTLSKQSHPQIKTLTDQSLKQKYGNVLMENLRLEEKVEARDRIIEQRCFFPTYHSDQRISTLRKAVSFWYNKAEHECARMKARCRDMKLMVEEEGAAMRELISRELSANKEEVSRFAKSIGVCEQSTKPAKKTTKTTQPIKTKQTSAPSRLR